MDDSEDYSEFFKKLGLPHSEPILDPRSRELRTPKDFGVRPTKPENQNTPYIVKVRTLAPPYNTVC